MLLSVIIPIYNVQEYLYECLESLTRQISADIEFICINDGSNDNSGNICEEYARRDTRFKVYHKKNEGVSIARNFGLKKSKGKYIAWVDPDDYISNDWFISIEPLLKDNIDFIFFDYYLINNDKQMKVAYGDKSAFIDKNIFIKDICLEKKIKNQLWQKIYKKDLMNNIFFPEDVNFMEDYAVLHKIVLRTKNIFYLAKKLYFYRIRNEGLSSKINIQNFYKGYLIAKSRYNDLLKNDINISKLMYLLKLLWVSMSYHKITKEEQKKYKTIYKHSKKNIQENVIYILKEKIDLNIKIKFLLCSLGVEGITYKIYKFVKKR